MRRHFLIGLLALSGCGGKEGGVGPDADTDSDSDTGTGTGTGTDSGTGSESETDTGSPCPDLDTECDLVTGDGCAAGLRCGYWWAEAGVGDPEIRCLEPGDITLGSSCHLVGQRCGGYANDCVESDECIEPRDGAGAQCLHYCSGPGTCTDGSPCGTTIPWSPADLSVCVEGDACDPATQTGCAEGEGCYIVTDTVDWTVQCVPFTPEGGSTGRTGAPCTFVEHCAPGFQCATFLGGSAVCRPVCSTADNVCPAATGECQPVPDLPDWGICLQ